VATATGQKDVQVALWELQQRSNHVRVRQKQLQQSNKNVRVRQLHLFEQGSDEAVAKKL